MFENYRAWRKRNLGKANKADEHNWGTIVHLIVNKGGRQWFDGWIWMGIWVFACMGFFFGVAAGSMMYVESYTVPMWVSAWWPWMLGAVIVGVLIELKMHSTRDFYRNRRAMYGSWFK